MNKSPNLIMKYIITFPIFIGCILVGSASAQNISVDRIGDFEFKIADKSGWKASPEASAHVENIFKYEGVKLVPSFAYANSYGSLVFGAVKKLRDGLTFSSDQLSSSVPQFPEVWGIKNNEVQNSSGRTDYGLEFAVMRASGPGDGKVFGKGKLYKTLGVWIDIPVQYQDSEGYQSVLISLFYRGYDSKKSADENFLKAIMNSLMPVKGVTIITEKKYKTQFQSAPEEAASNKNEAPKVDLPPKIKAPEVSNMYLMDIVKSINSVAKREVALQTPAVPISQDCESLELVNEQEVSLISLMKVVEANYVIYHKCVAMLRNRPLGALKPETPRR